MENRYHFTETQRFRQWWIWLIMITTAIFPLLPFMMGDDVQLHDPESWGLAIITPVLVMGLFLVLRLDTWVDGSGIHYRFFPVHLREKTLLWDDVESVEIREYKPLGEYGGWGIRYSLRNGRALNVSGNMGLQLTLKSGKKILIGTQKAGELEAVLKTLQKL